MKVGLVALHWPPDFGGAEQYNSRLIEELNTHGVEAYGITPRLTEDKMDNGTSYVHRIAPHDPINLEHSQGMKRWLKSALEHIEAENYTHILVSNCRTIGYPFLDFINQVKDLGIKTGVIHFDLDKRIRLFFEQMKTKSVNWEAVQEEMMEYIKGCFAYDSPLCGDNLGYWAIDSPLYFNPDFVVSCSEWSNTFIDPFNTTPSFVLHPFLPLKVNRDGKEQKTENNLKEVDITMINPMYHKGRSYMADIVNDYSNKWTYRILLGGYGGDKEDFLRMIQDSWAVRDGRVEIIPYVENMEDVWTSTKLFIFPSRFEGYGMAAVEPMVHGVPVMVQDYPSIMEAVGDSAFVHEYNGESKEWIESIEEIFFDDEEYGEYQQKGYERVQQLKEREGIEIPAFIEFLEKLL